MAVVMVFLGILSDRDHASVRHFADRVFELNGCMVNAEIAQQALLHVAQDALAHRGRDVGDRYVAGQRVRL